MSTASDARSDDFLRIANQFKLGALTTEGSHPVTATLSETAAQDTAAALRLLFDVDDDVVRAYGGFVESARATPIAAEVAGRLRRGGRIFFTGCGARPAGSASSSCRSGATSGSASGPAAWRANLPPPRGRTARSA